MGARVLINETWYYDYGKEYFNLFLAPSGCRCTACRKKRDRERVRRAPHRRVSVVGRVSVA